MSWRDPGGTSVLRKGSLGRRKEHMSTPPDSENGFLPGNQRFKSVLSPEQEPGKQQGRGSTRTRENLQSLEAWIQVLPPTGRQCGLASPLDLGFFCAVDQCYPCLLGGAWNVHPCLSSPVFRMSVPASFWRTFHASGKLQTATAILDPKSLLFGPREVAHFLGAWFFCLALGQAFPPLEAMERLCRT